MSGPFSSVVNFSVHEFLTRAEKLTVLQSIKCASSVNKSSLVFPRHHKESQHSSTKLSSPSMTATITDSTIEEIVFSAYRRAGQVLAGCEFSFLHPSDEMISFDNVNHLAYINLTRSKCKTPQKRSTAANCDEEEEDEEYHEEHQCDNQLNDADISVELEESTDIDEADLETLPNVSSTTMRGMRVFDSIGDDQHNSFFSVQINGQQHTCTSKLQTGTFRRLNSHSPLIDCKGLTRNDMLIGFFLFTLIFTKRDVKRVLDSFTATVRSSDCVGVSTADRLQLFKEISRQLTIYSNPRSQTTFCALSGICA